MIENIKKVTNPLTVIAIFAGLSELASTVSIGFVDKSLQEVYLYFIMIFPTLLVILFFLTLNLNHKALYAPSDYKDETNFIYAMRGFSAEVNSITINKDNFENYEENLKEIDMHIKSKIIDSITSSKISLFERKFFENFMRKSQPYFESRKIKEIEYSIHSPNHFLLSIYFVPESDSLRKVTNFIFYFKAKDDKVFLEVLGKDIYGDDSKLDEIIERLYQYINKELSLKKIVKGQ